MNLSFSRCMLIIISIIYAILLIFPQNNYAVQQESKDTYYQIDSKLYNSDLINLLSNDIINKSTVFSSIKNSIYDVPNSLTALAFNKFLRTDQKQRLILYFLSQIYSTDTYSRLSYMDTFREIIMTNDSSLKDLAYFGLYLAERWYKANALRADNSIDDTIFLSLLQTYFAEKDISIKRKLQNWLAQNSFIYNFNPFYNRDKLNEFYSVIYNGLNLTLPSFSTSNIIPSKSKANDTVINKVIQFCTLIRTNKKNKTMDDLTFELQNILVDGHPYVKVSLLRNILFQIESEKDGLLLPDNIVSELLKRAFEDPHPLVRVLCLTCLVRNNYENRYTILKSYISREKDFYSKSMAIELLASVSWEKDTINIILDGCRSEVNAVVRLHWVWLITYTWNNINNRQQIIKPLIDITDNETNKYILRALLTFWGREKISEAKTSITNLIGKFKDSSNVQVKCYEALWKIDNCPDKVSLYAKSLSEKLSTQNNIQTSPEVIVWLEFYDENKKNKKVKPEIVQETVNEVVPTSADETLLATTQTSTNDISTTSSFNEFPEAPEIVEIFTSKSEEKKAAPIIGSKSSVASTSSILIPSEKAPEIVVHTIVQNPIPVVKEEEKHLLIKGSDSLIPLTNEWIKAYKSVDKNLKISASGIGTEKALSDLVINKADICLSNKYLNKEEIEKIEQNYKVKLKCKLVANDFIAIYVNKDVKVDTISIEMLEKIFTGKEKNWLKVNDVSKPITLFGRKPFTSTFQMFKKSIIPNDKVSSSITLYESNDKVIDCIANTSGAIGFAQYSDRTDVKLLLLEQNNNPLLFNENNINNYYPLYRKLFLIYNSEANPQTTNFIDWLYKPENSAFYNKVNLLPPNMSQIISDLEIYSDKFIVKKDLPTITKTIKIKGSDYVNSMSKCLAAKYMEKNPNIRIILEGGGSDLSISDGIFGKVDIIQSSEPLSESDKKYLANLKKLVYEHEIAMEVLTIFVHPENPVNELSIYQLQSIFSGKVNSWKDFGGKDVEIEVYTIPNITLTGLSFNKFVMKDKAFSHKAKFFETSDEVKIAVEKNPFSIGFGTFQRINIGKNNLKYLSIKKEDNDQAYPPSDKFIKVLLYPLCRYYYYYTIEDPDEQTKKFIEWVKSPEGQQIIEEHGKYSSKY